MEHPDIPWRLLRILSLAIIYDFMSFCAQLLRDALQMQADESQTRANVLFTLNTYRSNAQFLDQIVFHDAFSAIINNIKAMPPTPQSYALQTSPITTSYSRMSAINREDLLSETTDHTEENDDDNDDDDDDEYSDDESEGDDIDMTPPGSSSDHHRRCQEDLTRYNHPYVMGHKRSLWASIQTDTKRPARRKIIKTSDDNEFEETPGTSSSMHAPPMLQDPPLVTDDIVPALKTAGVPRMTVSVPYTIKEEEQQTLQLEHPPMSLDSQQSTQDILHPPMADLATPEPYRMRTPPAKSPSRDSVSATRRAKARALAEKKSLNLLTVTDKDSKFMSFKKTSHKTVIDSGASTSGTGLRSSLRDLRPTSCSVSAAFGETAQPTEMGLLPPFMLKTIVIDQMNDTTLLSVSQACAKGQLT